MEMTHYMELLATNQPWNLILFMAIPVILAETVAITELVILLKWKKTGFIGGLNRLAGIIGGWYFLGVFVYLVNTAVIPLTTSGGWRGIGDIIAVGFYLLGVIPLMGMALIDMNILIRKSSEHEKLKLHAIFVGIWLLLILQWFLVCSILLFSAFTKIQSFQSMILIQCQIVYMIWCENNIFTYIIIML